MDKNFFKNKWDMSRTYVVLLLLFDIFAINISSVIAMMLRFNGNVNIVPENYYQPIIANMPLNTLLTIGLFAALRLYKSVWRYVSSKETLIIIAGCVASALLNLGIFTVKGVEMYRSYYILYGIMLAALVIGSRYVYRILRYTYRAGKRDENTSNIMIVGAGDAGFLAINEIEGSQRLNGVIRCIIDDDKMKHGSFIKGKKVIGGREKIEEAVEKYKIDLIIIAMPSVDRKKVRDIVQICNRTECEVRIMPGMYQLVKGEIEVAKMR